jgi:mevalonate kinase
MPGRQPHAMGAAPGKVILFGEHAVVHGKPAIAAALSHGLGAVVSRRSEGQARLHIPRWGRTGLLVEAGREEEVKSDAIARAFLKALDLLQIPPSSSIDVTMDGELPLGVGLGSSAAFSVSLLRALAQFKKMTFCDVELGRLAFELESIFHGNPSGIDHSVIIHNECVRFMAKTPLEFRSIKLAVTLPLVVAWTPRHGTTKDAVRHVADLQRRSPAVTSGTFDLIESIVEQAVACLTQGDLSQLGDLMNFNHGALSALGVVSAENEKMVSIARDAGALGAKVTGAGFGGAMIALAPGRGENVQSALRAQRFPALLNHINNH